MTPVLASAYRPWPGDGGRVPERRERRGGRLRVRSALMLLVVLPLAAWLALFVGRGLVSAALDAVDYARAVHRDRTVVDSGVERQVRASVPLVWRRADGSLVRGRVDGEAFTAFTREAAARLEAARAAQRAAAGESARAALAPAFDAMRARVPDYADWYFAWPTGYAMLTEAAASTAGWLVGPDVLGLRDRLALDLERYVQQRFETVVLRPEISDPAIGRGFADALAGQRQGYRTALAEVDAAFEALVRAETTHLEPVPAAAGVALDWDSQRLKVDPAAYEKATVLRAVPSLGLALAGRSAGAAAARALAARAAQPFVARAAAAGGLAAAGAGAGILLGLGADYVANELLERSQRPRFEAETAEAVAAIERAWAAAVAAELERAADARFDDALALLPAAAAAGGDGRDVAAKG